MEDLTTQKRALLEAVQRSDVPTLKHLLSANVSPYYRNAKGQTTFAIAARMGHTEVLRLLNLAAVVNPLPRPVCLYPGHVQTDPQRNTFAALVSRLVGHPFVIAQDSLHHYSAITGWLQPSIGFVDYASMAHSLREAPPTLPKGEMPVGKTVQKETAQKEIAEERLSNEQRALAKPSVSQHITEKRRLEKEAVAEKPARQDTAEGTTHNDYLVERAEDASAAPAHGSVDLIETMVYTRATHTDGLVANRARESQHQQKAALYAQLEIAVAGNDIENVESLLKQGVDLRPMVWYADPVLVTAANQGFLEVARLLIAAGAKVNSGYDKIPMHCAAAKGHKEMAQLLLASGAELEDRGQIDRTALMVAAAAGQLEIVQMLVGYGANLMVVNTTGESATILAAKNGHRAVCEFLCEQGAPPPMPANPYAAGAGVLAPSEQAMLESLQDYVKSAA
ncbi:MAG: ankyrin repeat domain-containing protein [Cyanobacteria bacterium J06607_13]